VCRRSWRRTSSIPSARTRARNGLPMSQRYGSVHISPPRIQRIKERWKWEFLAGLRREERRLHQFAGPASSSSSAVPIGPCAS
jgi:hypothetical protein